MNENVIPSTTFKVHFNTLKSIADKLHDVLIQNQSGMGVCTG